jgi:hypothetical protein
VSAEAADRQGAVVAAAGGGVWVDAARWLAWWEAEQWARASWQAQGAAAWQLAKVGRWMMRDADDRR